MKLLVCVAKTPDTTSKISFTDNNTRFNEAGVQFIVNPYDEWYALVRAVELKEKHGGNVTVLTVGGADCEPILRKALAIGADDAVRIDKVSDDSMDIASQIAAYAKDQNFDIIFCGKETIDHNGSQVGGMVAAMLSLPYVSLAVALDIENGNKVIHREVKGGVEILEVEGPLLLSAAKGMAEQRIPNMPGIMKARTKPLAVISAVEVAKTSEVLLYSVPPAKKECTMVSADNPEELIRLLREEAKAL